MYDVNIGESTIIEEEAEPLPYAAPPEPFKGSGNNMLGVLLEKEDGKIIIKDKVKRGSYSVINQIH